MNEALDTKETPLFIASQGQGCEVAIDLPGNVGSNCTANSIEKLTKRSTVGHNLVIFGP